MNNPFEYVPVDECTRAFNDLCAEIEALKRSSDPEDVAFCRELDAGKMLGVMIAEDSEGRCHILYAFSGQLGDRGFHREGFVDPVFDYLQPDGYFKTKEKDISNQNKEIERYENVTLPPIRDAYNNAKSLLDKQIEDFKEKCRNSKAERKAKRDSGLADEAERAEMIRQSQFEKAELHRLKKRVAAELEPLAAELKVAESRLSAMKERRRTDSEALQQWLFDNFKVLNANSESRSLSDIFAETPLKTPPSGAGECCGPKLLQEVYRRGWRPLSMAEYWYGRPKDGEIRRHGEHYPACRGKCLPILSWMLQGLDVTPPLGQTLQEVVAPDPEIIYENRWFCVVNKPSGMLSVPGKGKAISLQQWLAEKYPGRVVRMAHRLDQDTSGLIVATFGELSFKVMQSLFARRRVLKTYVADLEGDYESRNIPKHGRIELPLSPDWLDRPRQRIDMKDGKPAVTDYEFIATDGKRSRVAFHPLTGRTHQLRVHAASEQGLGIPIAGDRLYGNRAVADRLHLHAHRLEFTFPIDRQPYSFQSSVPF